MRFETVSPAESEGAILVHSIRVGSRVFKKGRSLSKTDMAELGESGIAQVTIVRLEPDDLAEDEAAATIAHALAGPGTRTGAASTGRANIYAEQSGIVVIDATTIDAANLEDDSLTVATLFPFAMVAPGDMIATIKIIPFAAPKSAVATVATLAKKSPISVRAFGPLRGALITTLLPGHKASLIEKARTVMAARLAPMGGTLEFEETCAHETMAVAETLRRASTSGAEIVFVLGASAIADIRDVVPSGILAAGGVIHHFGMPVDPGNLLLLGELDGRPVIGLPGCARSPKLNGVDFVVQRLFAGLPVTGEDIAHMGVGGLLKEIVERPQPRQVGAAKHAPPRAPNIAAVILAGGLSSRMGSNKLLAEVGGTSLIRRAAETALATPTRPVIVVTGKDAERIKAELAGLDVRFAHNPHFADGLSTSLRTGIKAVPASCDGAVVMLGDMPEVKPSLVDRMIATFAPAEGRAICVATAAGKRGNPVLWARQLFAEMEEASGDSGAKHLIGLHEELVCEVDDDDSVLDDVDTPEDLDRIVRALQSHANSKVKS